VVTDDAKKKTHATRYVGVDTSELWETLPEFSDNTKTYIEFVTAVYKLYPSADEERKWSVADMNKLFGERSRSKYPHCDVTGIMLVKHYNVNLYKGGWGIVMSAPIGSSNKNIFPYQGGIIFLPPDAFY
jgi:hypothetical protein